LKQNFSFAKYLRRIWWRLWSASAIRSSSYKR